MNGQLSEQPPAELIREISEKSLGGRLRLEQKRVKVVAYFDSSNAAVVELLGKESHANSHAEAQGGKAPPARSLPTA